MHDQQAAPARDRRDEGGLGHARGAIASTQCARHREVNGVILELREFIQPVPGHFGLPPARRRSPPTTIFKPTRSIGSLIPRRLSPPLDPAAWQRPLCSGQSFLWMLAERKGSHLAGPPYITRAASSPGSQNLVLNRDLEAAAPDAGDLRACLTRES